MIHEDVVGRLVGGGAAVIVDTAVMAGVTVTLVAVVVLVALDWWVYVDAQTRERARRPVEMQLGTLQIDVPRLWLACCVVLFVVFFPLYLVARQQS
jgi:hypothetical protein